MRNFNKLFFYFSTITILALLFSCNKEKEGDVIAEITAVVEQSIKTRTVFTSNANIDWKADDQISIFTSTNPNNNKFAISICAGDIAKFRATNVVLSDQYLAVYPYSDKNTKVSSNEISCVIPTIQSATVGSFDTNALVMAAVGTKGQTVTFKNTCALLKFKAGDNIQSFAISANNKESIVGTTQIKFDANGNPTAICNGTDAVILRDAIEKGNTYYIVVAPSVLHEGYTIRATVNGKSKSMSYSGKTYEFKCNTITDLGTLTPSTWPGGVGFESVDLGLASNIEWSTMNVGATSTVDPGLYFQWGETIGYTRDSGHLFTKDTYSYSKYNSSDKKTILEDNDDAAHVNWGENWRMPSQKECLELIQNTYFEWTNNYMETGISGYIVYKAKSDSDKGRLKNSEHKEKPTNSYSTNDIHIFLPVTGYFADTEKKIQAEDQGFYWTSSLSSEIDYERSYRMYIYDGEGRTGETVGAEATGTYYRHVGRCIRPVRTVNK